MKILFLVGKKEFLWLRPKILVFACALVLSPVNVPLQALQEQSSNPAEWSRAKKEQFLHEAKIVSQKPLKEGITGATIATLSDESGTHDAQVQTIDEFKQKFESARITEFYFKDSWKYNVAAYLLDQILGLNMIPATVERKVDDVPASVTWWVDNVLMTEKTRYFKKIKPPDTNTWNKQMNIVLLFDELIANVDRNLGNLLITGSWNIWMIDHTRAFRTYHQLRKPQKLVRCDRQLLENLRKLDRSTLQDQLGKYLNKQEIDGVLGRRDAIVKHFDKKIAREGEESVLYDYLAERKPAKP